MAYGKSKDLLKRTLSDKFLGNKAFKNASNPKCDGCQRGLASMVYKFLNKKPALFNKSSSLANRSANEPNYQLANEFHKTIITKF